MNKVSRQYMWLFGFVLTIQVVLVALSFFVPAINTWLKAINLGELLIGYISVETTIIAGGLAWIHYGESERQRIFEEHFIKAIQAGAYSRTLSRDEFYSVFLSELKSCKSRVDIAYLAPYPPTSLADKKTKKYYDDSLVILKRRSNESLSYRRIVRLTNENWPWILSLCDQLKNVATFSMAVLEDSGNQISNPLALSVQTVDKERSYMVAVQEHQPYSSVSDIMISSQTICTYFDMYYNRIWSRSTIIMEKGKLNQENKGEIEAKLGIHI